VNFTFDDEQLALQDVARQALEREVDMPTLHALADDPTGISDKLWSALVDLGYTALLVPDEQGGAGAGLLETCIVLEQMGRVPLPGPFFSSAVLATLAARALGLDSLLPELAEGTKRGTVALNEAGYGDPLGTVRARARRKGADWVVSGHKPLVLDAHSADWALVVARTEEGVRTFLLDLAQAKAGGALECEPVPTLDPTRKAAAMTFTEQVAQPVGPHGNQAALWHRVLDDVATALAAESVGAADRALWEAVEYAKVRTVFDKPVASFQVAKHKIVDMFHMLEMARVGWQFAAWASDADDPGRENAVAMAASYACEAGMVVAGGNIQLHGGVGFTWDHGAHYLLKRVKQNEVLMGGAGGQRHRLARSLVGSV
jgi:alkylation response protein AidB-like acyl-CoA dehydrogenase